MMHLSRLILHKLRAEHVGKDRAITRADLLAYVREMGYDVSDRELRAVYAELPVVADSHGLYYPATAAEVQAFYEYLQKRVKAEMARAARVRRAHAGLFEDRQLGLPI